jgi:hypothetical protein
MGRLNAIDDKPEGQRTSEESALRKLITRPIPFFKSLKFPESIK